MKEINVAIAREYMKEKVEPHLSLLLEKLALERPDNVLDYIIQFAEEELLKKNKEQNPTCELTGLKADMKARSPGGTVSYYIQDSFDAMKRKGKLRGYATASVDEEFPEDSNPAFELEEIDPVKYTELEDKPVTPPHRGYKVTLPGQNYHDSGPKILGNVKEVAFEPRALGTNVKTENAEEERKMIAELAAKRLESTANSGIDHLLSEDQKAAMKEKRTRDEILGRIRAHYSNMGAVEPFGLAAAPIEVLQKHLQKCKRAITETAKAQVEEKDKTEKLRSLVTGGVNTGVKQQQNGFDGYAEMEAKTLNYSGTASGNVSENSSGLSEDEKRRRRAEAAAARFAKTKK